MTLPEQTDRHRVLLLSTLDDVSDAGRIPEVLDELSRRHAFDASAALLLLLTGLTFDERRARRHWHAIVDDLQELRAGLSRPVGIRTAVLDYFVNIHPTLQMPSFVEEGAVRGGEVEATAEPLPGAGPFREWTDYEVRRARRYGGTVGIALADLDDFASVNDAAGRDAGDRALMEVERRLRTLAEPYERVFHPGEDEFALLLPGADREITATRAQRLREAVAAPIDVGRSPGVRVRVSLGLAVFPGDALAADTLLERAAQALYEARAAGGDRTVAWRAERRRHVRRESAQGRVARVRAPHGPSACRVRLRDLSREGVAFFSETPFDIGAPIEVLLGAEPDGEVVRSGTVVHLDRPDRDDARAAVTSYRIGVAFDPPSDRAARPPERGRET